MNRLFFLNLFHTFIYDLFETVLGNYKMGHKTQIILHGCNVSQYDSDPIDNNLLHCCILNRLLTRQKQLLLMCNQVWFHLNIFSGSTLPQIALQDRLAFPIMFNQVKYLSCPSNVQGVISPIKRGKKGIQYYFQ